MEKQVYVSSEKLRSKSLSLRNAICAEREGKCRSKTVNGVKLYCVEDLRAYKPRDRRLDPALTKEFCSDMNITQTELGRDIGYSKQMMSLVWTGKKPMSPKMEWSVNRWITARPHLLSDSKWMNFEARDLIKEKPCP